MRNWIPPIAVAGLIFVASSIPGKELPPLPLPGFDKLEHGSIYALLGAATSRALLGGGLAPVAAIGAATAIASAYGASDEFHQSFVPNRSVDPFDWLADTLGGCAGASLWAFARRSARGG